ncbi:MAG TPA: TetR family transcriptional regulator [Sphingomonas sp.]|uniref:TetR/AcrR family transcriptional regulator n=1 Tax=Sphingomonas sp. TaxID=28214 RepID=UPI002CA53F7C|nr:TetR family transcriptional regulator [Sphingomonas sp.]HMI20497.1 TetR family transcriptional regulator [Sphingomonas sp.]
MNGEVEHNAARKPRADAQRNRELLLETAKSAFAAKGSTASLDEIARAAGVGIGTLYRHFPTRHALLESVYQNETRQLAEAANRLANTLPPVEALREWMRLFVDYIAAKQVMAEAFNAIIGDISDLQAASGLQVKEAISTLVDVAIADGAIRLDLEPLDLLRALVGVAHVNSGPDWEASAKQLVDILIAGLRTTEASV